jgi:hypothetical protein
VDEGGALGQSARQLGGDVGFPCEIEVTGGNSHSLGPHDDMPEAVILND